MPKRTCECSFFTQGIHLAPVKGYALFTDPRQIQSIICYVFLSFVVCVSPPMGPGTAWNEHFWSESILLKKLGFYIFRGLVNQPTVHSGGVSMGTGEGLWLWLWLWLLALVTGDI